MTTISSRRATAAGFLLPLIVGIRILAFALTATLALSPTEQEIRADTALMTRIGQVAAQRPDADAAASLGPARGPRWRPVASSRAAQARRQAEEAAGH